MSMGMHTPRCGNGNRSPYQDEAMHNPRLVHVPRLILPVMVYKPGLEALGVIGAPGLGAGAGSL